MRRRALLAPALAATPLPALAHSPIEGIGEFYGGLIHPLLVPSHALALLSFALLVGQRGLAAMRASYPLFALMLLVGLVLAGFAVNPRFAVEPVLLALAMTCGTLVALARAPHPLVIAALGAVLAGVIGMDSGVTDRTRQESFAALLGCWLGAAVMLIAVAGLAELVQRPWQRVALRVLGSWGAASAALVLALTLRGPA